MKVKLLRDARIRHFTGEIVDVSPAEAVFLLSTNSAVMVKETPAAPEAETKPKTVKTTKKPAKK